MAPTVQTGPRDERDRKNRNVVEKRSELVCRVKYNNTLPDIPFDPKFITYPFESNRFIQYKPTSLERTYKYDMLTEHDLGVTIDLINPDTYKTNLNPYADSEDERLLEEEMNTLHDSRRSRHHNTSVSWLRKTEYISTEYNRFTQKSDKHETKVGFKLKQIMKDEDLYKDRESQIKAIEKTFYNATVPITKHYSKPGVTPVEVLPVFPDFDLWKHPFAQVIFDFDPAPKNTTAAAVQAEEMSQAMIRGAVDESGEQFVAYFLPTEETRQKRKRDEADDVLYQPDDVYDYTLAREYNWNVKNKLSKGYEETYFFVFRDDVVYYNELETRVRLSKRRKLGATQVAKSRLIVKHRDLFDKEIAAQDARLLMLDVPQEEEEEEPKDDLMDVSGNQSGDEEGSGSEKEHESGRENDASDKESAAGSDKESGAGSDNESVKSGSSDGSRKSRRSNASSAASSRGSRQRKKSQNTSGSEEEKASGSESEAESDAGQAGNKKDEEEIFGSSSESEAEAEGDSKANKEDEEEIFGSASEAESEPANKKDEEEIFGSASSSDESS